MICLRQLYEVPYFVFILLGGRFCFIVAEGPAPSSMSLQWFRSSCELAAGGCLQLIQATGVLRKGLDLLPMTGFAAIFAASNFSTPTTFVA